jgi:hypothetical protein
VLLLVVSMVSAAEGVGVAVAHERWRRPLPGGAVIGRFSFDRMAPYERGRRRGIDIRARPGARVRGVCAGVVTHAGRVPRWGRGVTLRCAGGLIATELGLASLTVARGARVWPGAGLGRLGARGVLRLGARIASRRHGYVDPAALLRDEEWPALAPPPRRAKPPTRRPPPAPDSPPAAPPPSAVPPPAVAPSRGARSPAGSAPPWPVVAGLALLAAGGAGGGVARRRRRRRVRGRMVVVQR